MSEACFTAADILLPAASVPLDPWACIAVDQFTSQPEYWQRAEELAADPMVRKVYLGQHFELKKSHQLTQEMKNRKGQEVNE
jgi:hypothetical protein